MASATMGLAARSMTSAEQVSEKSFPAYTIDLMRCPSPVRRPMPRRCDSRAALSSLPNGRARFTVASAWCPDAFTRLPLSLIGSSPP